LQILLKKVDVEIGDFILVQLAGNRAFLVTQLNGFSAYESGITNGWRTSVNLSLTKNYMSALFLVTYYGSFHRHD